jgi:hypothetical protein
MRLKTTRIAGILIFNNIIRNQKPIDFDFVELRFASVLRLPLTLKGAKNRCDV